MKSCKTCLHWNPARPRHEAHAGQCLRETGTKTASFNACQRWAPCDDDTRADFKASLVVASLSGRMSAESVTEAFVLHDLRGA